MGRSIASYVTTDEPRSGRPRAPRCSMSFLFGRSRGIVNLPDLAGDGDHVGGVPDELQRGRLIQTVEDDGEGAIRVYLHERAGIWLRWSTLKGAIPEAL